MDNQNTQTITNKEQTPKQLVVEALKSASNVLVTISSNPTVDQLAACIGLTLMMNKLDKHSTAVFSGAIPSTIEFLEPEKTIEQNTDSLRDFIISLDKSKADKLRYKVEDEVVRIYITPYRTSISSADLDFTQGDFNVDVVVALGINNKDQLDSAIIEHGQILHDATVIDMSCGANPPVEMGSINWHESTASSLCEMLVSISEAFQSGLLDTQMSTAFLTGIVAETDRFSNDKTTPKVMTMSAQLMAAGANQQLIATQLAIKPPEPELPVKMEEAVTVNASAPGVLAINHTDDDVRPITAAPVSGVVQGSKPEGLNYSVREEPKSEDHSTVSVDQAANLLGVSGQDVTDTSASREVSAESTSDGGASPIEIDEHGNMIDLVAAEEEKAYAHKQKVIQPLNVEPPKPKTDLSTVSFDDPSAPSPEQPSTTATETSPTATNQSAIEAAQAVISELAAPASEIPNPVASAEQTLADLERAVDSPHVKNLPSAEQQAMAEAGYVPDAPAAPSTLPQFPLPENEAPQAQPVAPPPLPPPFVPPYMQPQPSSSTDELNLPNPQ
jgi:nanoRNase/pAp phosphatase (c-di-AMP/oligoRNAs hydrolase)